MTVFKRDVRPAVNDAINAAVVSVCGKTPTPSGSYNKWQDRRSPFNRWSSLADKATVNRSRPGYYQASGFVNLP